MCKDALPSGGKEILFHYIILERKMNMKEKLIRFMQGRYGLDPFAKFTTGVSLVMMLLFGFFPNILGYALSFGILGYSYFRMLSRNYTKRYNENQWFLKQKNHILFVFNNQKNRIAQNKTHHIYTCPACKQKIRIPKGKGKIQVRCPKCGKEFIKKS